MHVGPFAARRVQIAVVDLDVLAGLEGVGERRPDALAVVRVQRQGHLGNRHAPGAALGRRRRRQVLIEQVEALARVEPPDIDAGGAAQQFVGALGLLAGDLAGAVLAEVLEDDQQAVVGQDLGVRAHPEPAAALARQPVLRTRFAPRAQGRADVSQPFGVVQVEEVSDRPPRRVLGRPAGQLGPGGIDADDRVRAKDHEHVEAALEEPVGRGGFDPGGSLGIQVLAHPVSLVFNRYRRIG